MTTGDRRVVYGEILRGVMMFIRLLSRRLQSRSFSMSGGPPDPLPVGLRRQHRRAPRSCPGGGPRYLEDLQLPVYADVEDGDENYYTLVIATQSQLDRAGVTTASSTPDAPPGTRYLIAGKDFRGAPAPRRPSWSGPLR